MAQQLHAFAPMLCYTLCQSHWWLLMTCCPVVGLSHCFPFVMLSACQVPAAGHCAGQEAAAGPSPTPGAHACQDSAPKASSRNLPCAVCQAPVAPRGLQSPSAQKVTGDHRLAAQHQTRSTVSAPADLEHQQDQRVSAAAAEACWLDLAAGSATWPLQSSAACSQGSWGATAAATLQRLPPQWQLAADAADGQGPTCLDSGPTSVASQPTWSQASSTCAASTRLEAAEPWQGCLTARQHQAGPATRGAQALQGEPDAQYRHQTVALSSLLNSTSTDVDLLSTRQSRHPLFTNSSQDGAPQQAPASQRDEGKCNSACSHISWREAQSSVRPAAVARDSGSRSLAQHDLAEEQACSSENVSSSRFVQPSEFTFEGKSVWCVCCNNSSRHSCWGCGCGLQGAAM